MERIISQEEIDTMIKAVEGVSMKQNHDEPYTFPWEHEYLRNDCNGYDEGYKKGYKDGQNSLASAYAEGKGEKLLEDVKRVEYERGLNDAWEAARKIQLMSPKDLDKLFSYGDLERISANLSASEAKEKLMERISANFSSSEVIEKLKAWEEKNEIKVGDEVLIEGARGVIVTSGDICKVILWENGQFSSWSSDFYDLSKRKTGRHFDAIEEVLKQMQEKT